MYSPGSVPAVQRAQVGLPDADVSDRVACAALKLRRLTSEPGAELRCNDHAAPQTKRGLQSAGVRYLFGDADAPFGAGLRVANVRSAPDDRGPRHAHLLAVEAQRTVHAVLRVSSSNKVSDDNYFADFADRVAVTSNKTLPRDFGLYRPTGRGSARAAAELPDIAGSESTR